MALRITLKPNERIIIGKLVLTNGSREAEFWLKGEHIPLLRENQVIQLDEADTPCKRLYFVIQATYLGEYDADYGQRVFEEQVREIADAAPSLCEPLIKVSEPFLAGDHYPALRACKPLIEREAELLAAYAEKTSV